MMGEPRMAKPNWQCPNDWAEWSNWLAAGLHARNRWRLSVLLVGILFAHGRRTVTTWLRAAGVSDDYQDYYYFLAALGRKTKSVATRLLVLLLRTLPLPDRLLAVIDDTPTKRYGPNVEGAGIHHNPTPGPADQKYLYGHIWVTLSLAVRHPRFGPLALPLLAMLYVRRKTMAKIPKWRGWTFATKLVLAARLVEWLAPIVKQAGKTLWIVVDGGYVKAPFLRRALRAGATVIGRLRKDAALRDLPRKLRRGRAARSWPSAQIRQAQDQLGQACRPSRRLGNGPMHRLRQNGYQALQDLPGDVPPGRRADSRGDRRGGSRLVSLLLDRSERHGRGDYRSLRRPRDDRAGLPRREGSLGAGQQQVRNIWCNLAVYHLNLWMHTLVELWSWNRPHADLCDRSLSPWDDADRRPSHADRRNALRRQIIEHELSTLAAAGGYRDKFSIWLDASWRWPPDMIHYSESAEPYPSP